MKILGGGGGGGGKGGENRFGGGGEILGFPPPPPPPFLYETLTPNDYYYRSAFLFIQLSFVLAVWKKNTMSGSTGKVFVFTSPPLDLSTSIAISCWNIYVICITAR